MMNQMSIARVLAVLGGLVGLAALPAALASDPWSPSGTVLGVPVGFHLDLVSAVLLIFVGLLCWVVTSYSLTNLRGRARGGETGTALLVAVAGLLVTVSGSSLVMIAAGWTVSGLAVVNLVGRSGTSNSPQAARLMRRTLLTGDVFLWSGVLAAWIALPSIERTGLGQVESNGSAALVALLLLGACVARTGLVPAHRWLPETAEAPSPVSALLHAGIVNGAGVLVLLAWPLFLAAPAVLAGLLVIGAVSLVVGAWATRVRGDVKGRLACSTTMQMSYMCIQLGLGLPAAAMMHLVGHGSYKSWLFLRAGGALGRNDAFVEPITRPTRQGALAVVAALVALLAGLPASMQLVSATGVTALAPLALTIVAAGLAGHAVAGLRRVGPQIAAGVAVAGGLIAGAYAWVLLASEKLYEPVLGATAVWSSGVGAVLVGVVALAVVVLAVGYRHLEKHPDSGLALAMLPSALPPSRRWPLAVRRVQPPLPDASTEAGEPITEDTVETAVLAAARLVGPAWPLRNLVAANPLAGLETMAFDDALTLAGRAHGISGRPSLTYFLDLHSTGRITTDHLRAALKDDFVAGGSGVQRDNLDAFIDTSETLAPLSASTGLTADGTRTSLRLCEQLNTGDAADVTELVDGHTALWAQRAWGSTDSLYGVEATGSEVPDDPASGLWTRWRQAAARPTYDRAVGIRGAAALVRTLPEDPAAAISELAGWAGIREGQVVTYLVATLTSAPGWSGHAAWRARRADDSAPLLEWVAVRMAHDVLFSRAYADPESSGLNSPESRGTSAVLDLDLNEIVDLDAEADDSNRTLVASYTKVWQRALELGVEEWLFTEIDGGHGRESRGVEPAAADRSPTRPLSQSIWCIDVRSERVRRQLELAGEHRTFGFAGFFGASVRHLDPDLNNRECCPALLEPGFTATEEPAPLRLRQTLHRTTTGVSRNPLGSLVIAEAGGLFSAVASTITTLRPELMRRLWRSWTQNETSEPSTTGSGYQRPVLNTELDLQARTDLAAGALQACGLTGDFAPVIMVTAHAASPENNAYASAYACGACGGNGGVVNATLLVEALNDADVRHGLAARGLKLPADTVAVVAVHDTTSGEVHVLGEPSSATGAAVADGGALARVVDDLQAATHLAAIEQGSVLPSRQAISAVASPARAADWSEPTPEWGLAGNAVILIGPRDMSLGAELDARVFLHSYERDQDPQGAVLEVLLTAPLVVAQWINAQYYFSAVEPATFGAGDKTTHNVVGDVGVLRGAHGDLASGLPWQALFRQQPGTRPDAENMVHEPVRLLAFVVADPDEVLRIVTENPQLTQLIGNQWINFICRDGDRTLRLRPDLTWQEWSPAVDIASSAR